MQLNIKIRENEIVNVPYAWFDNPSSFRTANNFKYTIRLALWFKKRICIEYINIYTITIEGESDPIIIDNKNNFYIIVKDLHYCKKTISDISIIEAKENFEKQNKDSQRLTKLKAIQIGNISSDEMFCCIDELIELITQEAFYWSRPKHSQIVDNLFKVQTGLRIIKEYLSTNDSIPIYNTTLSYKINVEYIYNLFNKNGPFVNLRLNETMILLKIFFNKLKTDITSRKTT